MSSTDHEDIWGQYAKGVKPLHGKAEDAIVPKPKKKKTAPPQEEPLPWVEVQEAAAPSLVDLPQPESPQPPKPETPWKKEPLDLRVERNMSLGDVMIEAKLDLHGKPEQTAYETFQTFVESNYARGRRLLLVITGKGIDGSSVIRANLPRWCTSPPFENYVMAVRTAAQLHGGEGAYYVLLRKNR